jgi:hypothetical protein
MVLAMSFDLWSETWNVSTPRDRSAASGPIATFRRAVSESLGGAGLERSRAEAVSATCSLKILCDTSLWRTGSDRLVRVGIAPYTPKLHHIYGAILYYMARYSCHWRDSMV